MLKEINKIEFSIIVPIHNSEKYLTECLESICSQTFKDYEILFIDDNSSDNSINIIKNYSKLSEKSTIVNDNNNSYGFKINKGISLAKGNYVVILESDDYFVNDTLECFKKIIDIFTPDYVDGDFLEFYELGINRYYNYVGKYIDPIDYNHLVIGNENYRSLFGGTSAIWTGAYKKSFLDDNKIRLNESAGASYQDTSFRFLVSSLARKSYHIKKELYNYRKDNMNSSVKDESKIYVVCNEYEYLRERLLTKFTDNSLIWSLFYKWKYCGYFWNLLRLSGKSQELFAEFLINEISKNSYEFEQLRALLTLDKNNQFGVMDILFMAESIKNSMKDFICEKNNEKTIFLEKYISNNQLCLQCQNSQIIICGAGKYGREFFKRIEPEKKNIICYCDSSSTLQGGKVDEIIVRSYEQAIRLYPKAKYVITSQKSFSEVFQILQNYGIQENQIIQYFPE